MRCSFYRFFFSVVVSIFFSATLLAQFATAIVDGVIAPGEYGLPIEGQNQQTNAAQTWFMTWDNANLYVAIANANLSEAAVLYLDKDPLLPSNAGGNPDGTIPGFNYDNANFSALQFRADLVVYFKDGYREYRTADGAGGWSGQTAFFGSYFSGAGDVREIAIPWSVLGGRPAAFSWFGYVTSPGGFVYGQVPVENPAGMIGLGALYERYYSVSVTDDSVATKPFSRNSFVFNRTVDAFFATPLSTFDFSMNSPGRTLSLGGGAQVEGSFVLGNGTVRLDTVGPTENANALSIALKLVMMLGTLNAGFGPLTVGGDITTSGSDRFVAQGSTVILGGFHQKMAGSLNFNSLVKTSAADASLSFEAGSTITVSGSLTLAGSPLQHLKLRSSVPGTQWHLHATGSSTLDYLDVMDSDASGGLLLNSTTSINSGNNLNWFFGAVAMPILVVKPLTVNFGDVPVGQISEDSISITNTGLAPLTLSPPVIDSGSHPAFSITSLPATLILAPGESTMVKVSFLPVNAVDGIVNASVSVTSNGGSASISLSGRGIENVPPSVTILEPLGGETFASGDRVPIRFVLFDPEGIAEFKVSLSTDGGTTFDRTIARVLGTPVDSITKTILWNIPDNLETMQGRIQVTARDIFGNEASAMTSDFAVMPPVTPGPMIEVLVQFDPPPAAQIAPPQNVRVNASELAGGSFHQMQLKYGNGLTVTGNPVVGYNVYRVPKPPEGDPTPTAEEIVGDSTNLVGTVSADSLNYREVLFQSRGDRFVYSLTALYDDGSESDGSVPAMTEYSEAETSSAHGWFGPMDGVNSPWYTFPSVDAADLSISQVVPSGSPQGNRSLKFRLRNRGTNYASFEKFFGGIPRPSPLTGVELGIRKVGGTALLQCYVDYRQDGITYSSSNTPHITDEDWHIYNLTFGSIPNSSTADTIIFGFGGYGDSCSVYVDYIAFTGIDGYVFEAMGDIEGVTEFISIPPDSIITKDPIKGTFQKPVKRGKHMFPNWANLIDETVAQGGFQPGSTESDSAGGMRVGISHMIRTSADPLNPKWKPDKDFANAHSWVRLSKWNFKKGQGKSSNSLQKTLDNKGLLHTGSARGLDSTGVPGQTVPERKRLKKELKKLDPKKTSNKLFAELVALKFSIAASQLSKTPNGFGELIFDAGGNPFDEMSLVEITQKADTMMTFWEGVPQEIYDSLYSTLYNINRAFSGRLDTVTFEEGNNLIVAGAVQVSAVPFIKESLMPPRTLRPTSDETESDNDPEFADEEWEDGMIPMAAKLYQNYPNPFNPATTIAFRLRSESLVTIRIYDLLGREVGILTQDEEFDEGYQTASFVSDGLSSGVYFYRIEAQGLEDEALMTIDTRKMLLLK